MSIQSVPGSAAHVAAATQATKPQSTSALPAKPNVAPPVAAPADSDGDHDGSGGGRISVKA